MLDLVIVILSSLANFLLGLFVLLRNPQARINRLFAFFSLSTIGWSVTNYLADNLQSGNVWYTRMTFVAGVCMAISIYFISNYFPSAKGMNSTKLQRLQVMLASSVALLSITPLIVQSTVLQSSGLTLEPGLLYGLYIIFIIQLLWLVIYTFGKKLRESNSSEQAQIKLLLIGVSAYAVLAISFSLVLPLVVDDWSSSRFGPISTLAFVGITAYAIIRHGLLDIRFIVVRSVGYVFSVGILVLAYAVVSSLIIGKVFSGEASSFAAITVSAVVLVASVLLYQPLRKFFNRVTNKFFYQDAYDTQSFLDQLNKTVISNIELGILLRHSAQVIEDNLKCEYVVFSVFENEKDSVRYVSNKKKIAALHEMRQLRNIVTSLPKIIDKDLVEGEQLALHRLLVKNNISVLAKLVSSLDSTSDPTAFMLLGPKKSGNRYSQQDLQIIEIIADELVVAIQNALRFEEIQNFNITLQEKVDEATRKLRKTNEKLKEMDETKDDFISMASHQLRTPLTSVKGYLSMVLEGDAGKVTPMQRKMLEQAFTSSQRMTYLISDLLNVSRLKTGKFVIERTPTNLVTMVQQEIAQLTEAAKGRSLTLVFNPPKDFPTVMLDETKTRQLVMNFVDNAIYYTPPEGTIEIKITDKPESIELTVVDDGLGVPKRDQLHLFTKFYRANNARKARPDGTGLGLYMAKKVVIAQGGAIIFKSQEGKGSTFGFTFPKTPELLEK